MHSRFKEWKILRKLVFLRYTHTFGLNSFLKSQPPNGSFGVALLLQSQDSWPIFPHFWGLMFSRKLNPVRCGSVIATRLWRTLSSLTAFSSFNNDMGKPHLLFQWSTFRRRENLQSVYTSCLKSNWKTLNMLMTPSRPLVLLEMCILQYNLCRKVYIRYCMPPMKCIWAYLLGYKLWICCSFFVCIPLRQKVMVTSHWENIKVFPKTRCQHSAAVFRDVIFLLKETGYLFSLM